MTAIRQHDFVSSIADALQYISYYHPKDFLEHLARAYEREQSAAAKDAIAQILTNSRMCAEGRRPICQDTGMPTFFVKTPVGLNQLALTQVVDDEAVDIGEGLVAEFVRELDERRGIGDFLLIADAAEPPPSNRVGHLGDKGFVAELVAELEVHQPQIRRDRHTGPSLGLVESRQERLHEPLVLKQDINAGQFLGQRTQFFGKEAVPEVGGFWF